MGRRETLGLMFVTLILCWLPYLFGWAICPPKMSYLWLIYNPDDQNVHLMWAKQAVDGAWHFKDLFTTEPHLGLFFNVYALLLGWFCRITGISLHFGYQLFRTVVDVVFLVTAFWFGKMFLHSKQTQKVYAWLICFSSGFGWIPMLWWWQTGQRPFVYFVDVSPELMMPEANSFLSMCVAPLAVLGVTLSLLTLGNLFLSIKLMFEGANHIELNREGHVKLIKHVIAAIFCGTAVSNVHSYAVIPVLFSILIWQLSYTVFSRKLKWKFYMVSALISLPCLIVLAVQAVIFSRDVAFMEKSATLTLTPSWFVLLGSYGIIAMMAISSIPSVLRKLKLSDGDWLLPLSWLIAIVIAIHLPVSFQRKMIEGMHVILCLFSAFAWEQMSKLWAEKFQRLSALVLVVLTSPSQVAFFALNGYWLTNNNLLKERLLMPPYFISDSQLSLFRWVEKNSDKDDAILCHPMLGNYLSPLTGRKVFIGHWAETLKFPRKLKQAHAIWEGKLSPSEAKKFFQYHKIRYALETDFERGTANGKTALTRYGKVVYKVGQDKIIRLK